MRATTGLRVVLDTNVYLSIFVFQDGATAGRQGQVAKTTTDLPVRTGFYNNLTKNNYLLLWQ